MTPAGTPAGEGILDALARVPLFSGLDTDVLAELARTAVRRSYRRGQLLFAEGDPGDALLALTSGSITIFRSTEHGDRAVLAVLRPPDALGEIALLDGEPRSASAEATESSSVLAIPRSSFLQLLRHEPALVEPLFRALGRMVRRLTDQAADHVFLDVSGRIAKTLLRLVEEAGGTPAPQTPVLVRVSQGQLAEMVGATRQSVNQVLGSFARRGLVRVQGRGVLLLEIGTLRARAGLPPLPIHTGSGKPPADARMGGWPRSSPSTQARPASPPS